MLENGELTFRIDRFLIPITLFNFSGFFYTLLATQSSQTKLSNVQRTIKKNINIIELRNSSLCPAAIMRFLEPLTHYKKAAQLSHGKLHFVSHQREKILTDTETINSGKFPATFRGISAENSENFPGRCAAEFHTYFRPGPRNLFKIIQIRPCRHFRGAVVFQWRESRV